MPQDLRTFLPRLREVARRLLESTPRCHDWDHTQRVCAVARQLAREEGADESVVECAALLHDIGRAEEFADGGKTCHALAGAGRAAAVLNELGVTDRAFIEQVADCVRTHRFRKRGESPPLNLEARVVFDADKLDSLGAIGIGRAFHFAGRIGARVHNTREEALGSEAYSLEDTAYREFLVKLRRLHASMLTEAGRRMAEDRHRFMLDFFDRLDREVRAAATR